MKEMVVYRDEVLSRLPLAGETKEFLRATGIPKTISAMRGLSALAPDQIIANENPGHYFRQMGVDEGELQPRLPLTVFMTDVDDDMIASCLCLDQSSGCIWKVSNFGDVAFVNTSIECFVDSVREWEDAMAKCKPGSYQTTLAAFNRNMRLIDLPSVRSFRGFWSFQIAVQVEEYD